MLARSKKILKMIRIRIVVAVVANLSCVWSQTYGRTEENVLVSVSNSPAFFGYGCPNRSQSFAASGRDFVLTGLKASPGISGVLLGHARPGKSLNAL